MYAIYRIHTANPENRRPTGEIKVVVVEVISQGHAAQVQAELRKNPSVDRVFQLESFVHSVSFASDNIATEVF